MTRDRETARRIAQEVQPLGGSVYYVGGCVRDRLLGRESKDLDIEVHGVTPQQLEIVLDRMGGRRTVGVSFGVYGLAGCGLDIAMPRRETTVGRGHRDFTVEVDPWLGPERAARRRDFTVNALMEDVLTGRVLDFFGGREDLRRGLLRHVDDHSFPEDPLRVLRGAQFAARFGFTVAEETVALCRTMDLSALSRERVEGELQKALLQAPRPSIFFRTLDTMHQLRPWFTEVQRLQGVPQPPRYHGEGDVWEHTMAVLDAAAELRPQAAQPMALMQAALAHDFGKVAATTESGGVGPRPVREKSGGPAHEAQRHGTEWGLRQVHQPSAGRRHRAGGPDPAGAGGSPWLPVRPAPSGSGTLPAAAAGDLPGRHGPPHGHRQRPDRKVPEL